ncbi:MAG: BrnA antitoxin family protein [Azoarcus sp.]|nr:BrnA antitoxin family protein [Azoarcus sp.]
MMLNSGTIVSARAETADRLAALRRCARTGTLPAEHIELSLDSDVLDALREMGKDWEAHFNAILREWLRSNSPVT